MKQNILVIRFSSLGDIVLTSPTVINLRIAFPKSHIVFLTKEYYREISEMIPEVDEVVTIPNECGTWGFLSIIRRLECREFDIIIDLHGNFRSCLARHLIFSNRTFVYPKNRIFRFLVTRKYKILPKRWDHIIDQYNQTVEDSGHNIYCRRPQLVNSKRTNRLTADRENHIVIAPGASFENKKWSPDRFKEVALSLYKTHGAHIDWVVISSDRVISGLENEIPGTHFKEHVDLSLADLCDLISRAQLTIANDSGIAHISSALNTPVISIFGPTHPVLGFEPKGLLDFVMHVDEPCRPCSRHGGKACRRDKRYCFDLIFPDDIIAKANDVLSSNLLEFRAVFIDRDGTLIVEKDYLSDPVGVELEEGAVDALRMLKEKGYKVVVVSNQSGVARGYFGEDEVNKVNNRIVDILSENGIGVDGIYFCPFHENGTIREFTGFSPDRKPGPGMAEKAALELGIDLRKSFVIGDTLSDLMLGVVAGAESILVKTGYGCKQAGELIDINVNRPFRIVKNLKEAAEYIVSGCD